MSDKVGSLTTRIPIVELGIDSLRSTECAPTSARTSGHRWKAATVSEQQSRSLMDVQLLLVDDSSDNQLLFTRILSAAGAQVTVASNGREAILAQAGGDYDVIIMDIQMPEVDGYMATSAIRANGYTGPVIALTAHDIPGEERRCRDAGCSHFETKPIDRSNLLRAVFAAISQD